MCVTGKSFNLQVAYYCICRGYIIWCTKFQVDNICLLFCWSRDSHATFVYSPDRKNGWVNNKRMNEDWLKQSVNQMIEASDGNNLYYK